MSKSTISTFELFQMFPDAEAKAAAEAAEIARREADKEHRATVNRAALAALVDAGIDEATAKRVVEMIAGRRVPHVSISY